MTTNEYCVTNIQLIFVANKKSSYSIGIALTIFFYINRPKEPPPVAIWETEIYQI
ncbi:MAG TPA: hypothetical protein VE944_32285 [Nostoc sp.]|uniref:hypothetical protein n=1 Tax=Nostoc sp. TaxID=1180 RepID=UPI002D56718D|nr:hypothetical protein [Nostoc sp.]HYX18949.1 hypothetical protein [Nostoc sp.]